MKAGRLLLSAWLSGPVSATPLSAQEPEQVSGEVTCAECVITLDTIVTIGGLDGPGLDVVSGFSGVAVDRRDRLLVWTGYGSSEISVFDSTGEYLRTIGGAGQGPGEYRSVSYVGVGRRYIHVFDSQNGRTMLDHDFRVVRTDRFPGQILSVAVVGDDVAVFAGNIPTPAAVGHSLHLLWPSGEMASYGYDGETYLSQTTPGTTGTSVAGRGGTVWTVQRHVNRIVRWDLAPEPRVGRVFDRHVVEFIEGGDAFAPATLGEAMLDDRGLWIVWHGADPDWKGPPPTSRKRSELPLVELRDSWLDLVDPATGRTIARYQQDGALSSPVAGSSYLLGYEETDAGVPYLHILEPRLSRR